MPQSAATGALTVEGLVKAFGATPVLDRVGLAAPAGRVVAVVGPSGCGKTTLLRCIAGLERPDAGQVRLDDRPLSSPTAFVPPERRRIGMVFQDGALFPHLSVAGNLRYGLARGQRRDGARVEQALALVDLARFGDRMPASLSGGQAQRVALARALVTRPEVLFGDEPTGALDSQTGREVLTLLRSMVDGGQTVIMVTHDPVAASYADRVVFLADGSVRDELYDPSAGQVAERMTAPAVLPC